MVRKIEDLSTVSSIFSKSSKETERPALSMACNTNMRMAVAVSLSLPTRLNNPFLSYAFPFLFYQFLYADGIYYAIRATPTSAKTASHKVASPPTPKASTNSLTPKASEMFCHTIRRVCLPAQMAVATFEAGRFVLRHRQSRWRRRCPVRPLRCLHG